MSQFSTLNNPARARGLGASFALSFQLCVWLCELTLMFPFGNKVFAAIRLEFRSPVCAVVLLVFVCSGRELVVCISASMGGRGIWKASKSLAAPGVSSGRQRPRPRRRARAKGNEKFWIFSASGVCSAGELASDPPPSAISPEIVSAGPSGG
jgi:hypothetical protein